MSTVNYTKCCLKFRWASYRYRSAIKPPTVRMCGRPRTKRTSNQIRQKSLNRVGDSFVYLTVCCFFEQFVNGTPGLRSPSRAVKWLAGCLCTGPLLSFCHQETGLPRIFKTLAKACSWCSANGPILLPGAALNHAGVNPKDVQFLGNNRQQVPPLRFQKTRVNP